MTMSDPIADMLTRMRNAMLRQHSTVSLPYSRIKRDIAVVLKDEGYIEDFSIIEEHPQNVLRINLKYLGDRRESRSMITKIERISKPGRRIYVSKDEIPWVLQGMGISIMTTSRGVITGQNARRIGVGGEVLCKVY